MYSTTKLPDLKKVWTSPILLCLLMALMITSCQKEASTQFEGKITTTDKQVVTAAKQFVALAHQHNLSPKSDLLQMNRTHIAANQGRNGQSDLKTIADLANNADYQSNKELFRNAINPDDFDCEQSLIGEYADGLVNELSPEDLNVLFPFGFDIPTYEALLFDNTKGGDYFGADGEYTSTITKNFVRLQTFWDIPRDIHLADMHGATFENVEVVAEVIQFLYVVFDENGNPQPVPDDIAINFAEFLKVIFASDAFWNYKHPMFTYNAFAFGGAPSFGIPKKIVMGDGILEPYKLNSFRTIADPFILAHEYGHQIQFANGYFGDDAGTPEGTRRTELMADAYAAYYLAHQSGAFLERGLISRFAKTGRAIGDCGFDSPGHHGTPNQREKAAEFGARVAVETSGLRRKVLSSQEFFELFEAALPELIAPDAN